MSDLLKKLLAILLGAALGFYPVSWLTGIAPLAVFAWLLAAFAYLAFVPWKHRLFPLGLAILLTASFAASPWGFTYGWVGLLITLAIVWGAFEGFAWIIRQTGKEPHN